MASETKAKKKQKRKKITKSQQNITDSGKTQCYAPEKNDKKYEIFTNSEKKCNNSYSHGSFEISKEI